MEFDALSVGYSPSVQMPQTNTPAKESPTTEGFDIRNTASSAQQLDIVVKDVGQDVKPVRTREKELNEEDIAKAVSEANKQLRGSFREFSYGIHRKTNTVMIKVINSDTKETIREIPPEKTLDALAKMWELAGIIVDEKK